MFKSRTSNLREEKESEEKELGKRVSRKEDHSSKAREKAETYETLCFPKFCGSGGSKSRLAKAANAEPSGCTPLWREAYLILAAFFGKSVVEQSACECGAKQISKSEC